MAAATERVYPVVGVTGVLDDLLIFLIPPVHRVPIEGDIAGNLADAARVVTLFSKRFERHVVAGIHQVLPHQQRLGRIDHFLAIAHHAQPLLGRHNSGRRHDLGRHTFATPTKGVCFPTQEIVGKRWGSDPFRPEGV